MLLCRHCADRNRHNTFSPADCVVSTMASMIAAGAAMQLCSAKPFTTCRPSRALRAARQPICAAPTAGCRDQVIKRRCTWQVHHVWSTLQSVAEAQLREVPWGRSSEQQRLLLWLELQWSMRCLLAVSAPLPSAVSATLTDVCTCAGWGAARTERAAAAFDWCSCFDGGSYSGDASGVRGVPDGAVQAVLRQHGCYTR
jgi:hypothetical protein